MSAPSRPGARTFSDALRQSRLDLGLPSSFDSNELSKHYFTRVVIDRQSQLCASGEHRVTDCPKAPNVIYREVQSPFYRTVLMEAPYKLKINGHMTTHIVSASTAEKLRLLEQKGFTRAVHTAYSDDAIIPQGVLDGSAFSDHTRVGDLIIESHMEAPLLAPAVEAPIRVVPTQKNWYSTYFSSKSNQVFFDFWRDGDATYLPAKDWSKGSFSVDTYKNLCQAVCVLQYLDSAEIFNKEFKASYFRGHELIKPGGPISLRSGMSWSTLARQMTQND